MPFGKNLYAIKYVRLLKIDSGTHGINSVLLPDRTNDVVFLTASELLSGGQNGLFKVNLNNGQNLQIKGISDPVTKILQTPLGIWAITKGNGLYQYRDGHVFAANVKFNIAATVMNDMVFKDNHLWIGSNTGLVKVNLADDSSKTFGMGNGLPSDQILKLSLTGNDLFMSTPDGICSFDIRKNLQNQNPPRIYLNKILVNGNLTNLMLGNILPYDKNSMEFHFDVLTFKSNKAALRYKLTGRDTKFSESKGNILTFENLEPGNYELVVYALNNNSIQSEKPVIMRFDIDKPLWKKWWFIAMLVLFCGLAVWLIAAKIITGIKKKEIEKTRINKLIADSQLTALQAQMNPHFIFNAINSIQNYILKKQETEAYSYLAKFSKLIRLVLHNSQLQMLSLSEEVETIKLYIELEQLRFSDSFDFEISIAKNIDEFETVVPTMIIQPYLENAIWHGLMNLDGQRRGKILLAFERQGELLRIEITDNGIGRELSKRFQHENSHQPIAMKLTEQRIQIANGQFSNSKINVSITDLYDAAGNVSGTKVVLCLPISNFD